MESRPNSQIHMYICIYIYIYIFLLGAIEAVLWGRVLRAPFNGSPLAVEGSQDQSRSPNVRKIMAQNLRKNNTSNSVAYFEGPGKYSELLKIVRMLWGAWVSGPSGWMPCQDKFAETGSRSLRILPAEGPV